MSFSFEEQSPRCDILNQVILCADGQKKSCTRIKSLLNHCHEVFSTINRYKLEEFVPP